MIVILKKIILRNFAKLDFQFSDQRHKIAHICFGESKFT